ncbi:MAG TPA: nitronate monooxygenase family protein [Castellaniella sp.]|uniref:NAD(P)H-dependent flavin oxidoreductase n=1 Tax=Castellaniella sp. TaxID=1955812 RepID=UPI002EE40C0A
MTIPAFLQNLALPVVAAPMFTVSYPELALAQCKAGIVGSMPALNARSPELLDQWLTDIAAELSRHQAQHPDAIVGPLAINLIVHASNARLAQDLDTCVRHRVPILISSLRAPSPDVIAAVHGYGGIVLHDVINLRHAHKALDAGVDGLILVAAGAGGHGGLLSPFALVGEVRRFFSGPLVLSGAVASGRSVLAAQAMGADLAYVGTRFIASEEAHADPAYKQAIVESAAADIIYSNLFSGVHGNYLRSSIERAGLDPDHLPVGDKSTMDFKTGGSRAKTWKDIWGAGQGVGLIDDIPTTAEIVDRLTKEYEQARTQLARGAVSTEFCGS